MSEVPKIKISSEATSLPHALEIVSPASTRALFWRAHYLQDSTMLAFLPFMFWLVSTLRPARYFELGMSDAVSYFAVCQALDKLVPEGMCTGLWNAHSEPTPIPTDIVWRNSEFFAEISKVLTTSPSTVVKKQRDGSIDLLLVNLWDRGKPESFNLEEWLPKLSKKSVILIRGMDSQGAEDHPETSMLRGMGLRCPAIHFDNKEGLTVLLWGEDRHDALSRLAALEPESAARIDIDRVFARLGAAHEMEWASRHASQQNRSLKKGFDQATLETKRLKEELTLSAQSYNERSRIIAIEQARAFDLEKAQVAAAEEIATLKGKLHDSISANNTLKEEIGGNAQALEGQSQHIKALCLEEEALKNANDELTRQIEAARDEINAVRAELTQELEAERIAKAAETAAREAVAQDLKTLQAELEARQTAQEVDRAEHAREMAALTQEFETLRTAKAAETATREAVARDLKTLQAERAGHTREMAAIQKKLEAQRTEHVQETSRLTQALEQAQTRLETFRQETKALKDELYHANTELHIRRDQVTALEASTSWRVTAPMRRVVDSVRGRAHKIDD